MIIRPIIELVMCFRECRIKRKSRRTTRDITGSGSRSGWGGQAGAWVEEMVMELL